MLCHVNYYLNRFFFFFQAEDGIRDGRVTGVQTCALPISYVDGKEDYRNFRIDGKPIDQPEHSGTWSTGEFSTTLEDILRSEERRVGKECRSRWSPYH